SSMRSSATDSAVARRFSVQFGHRNRSGRQPPHRNIRSLRSLSFSPRKSSIGPGSEHTSHSASVIGTPSQAHSTNGRPADAKPAAPPAPAAGSPTLLHAPDELAMRQRDYPVPAPPGHRPRGEGGVDDALLGRVPRRLEQPVHSLIRQHGQRRRPLAPTRL